jgi:LemA protein
LTRTRLLAIFAPILVILSACGINSVPAAEEVAKARWADVQVYYQRRANLIPNLVATVRAAAASEERILTNVTQARANATRITLTPEQLNDPAAMARYQDAQNRLSAAILPLRQLQEQYPELQSQRNFGTLMSQLEGTENRIAVARRDYIQAVQKYNTELVTFPGRIWAMLLYSSYKEMAQFTADEKAMTAPTVNFN